MLESCDFDLFPELDMNDAALLELLSALPLPDVEFGDLDALSPPDDTAKSVAVPHVSAPPEVAPEVAKLGALEPNSPSTFLPVMTHSRKHKHRTRHVPRAQRERSTQSYLFSTVRDEAHYRLFAQQYDKRAEKLNKLLRTCYHRFGDGWVTWNAIKQVAVEVGYSKTNSLFRTMWPMVSSRYGRFSSGTRSCEVLGLNFPYWVMDESTRPAQGLNAGNTLLRLAPEFFEVSPPSSPGSECSADTRTTHPPSFTDLLLDIAPIDFACLESLPELEPPAEPEPVMVFASQSPRPRRAPTGFTSSAEV